MIFPEISHFISNLPLLAFEGDFFAISMLLVSVYFLLYIVNKLTGIFIFLVKRFFLLLLVTFAFYRFNQFLIVETIKNGLVPSTILLGFCGFLIGFFAFVIALSNALNNLKIINNGEKTDSVLKSDDAVVKTEDMGGIEKGVESIRDFVSSSIKDDKSLGAVLSYIIISEFGVFSSRTISAPNENVGLGFFIVFIFAALLFIHQSYKSYIRGLEHLVLALVVGGVLSIILGHFWSNYPLEVLLSKGYFATDSLVALVTGLSVSLFMGSKG